MSPEYNSPRLARLNYFSRETGEKTTNIYEALRWLESSKQVSVSYYSAGKDRSGVVNSIKAPRKMHPIVVLGQRKTVQLFNITCDMRVLDEDKILFYIDSPDKNESCSIDIRDGNYKETIKRWFGEGKVVNIEYSGKKDGIVTRGRIVDIRKYDFDKDTFELINGVKVFIAKK